MTIQLRSHIPSTENSALRTQQYFPIISHNIKTSADVGATFHIEPNHNPRAREPALAWFALTRQGGQLIPLEQCDCQLAVYSKSSSELGSSPILEPSLKAISAEKYQGIPGADLVFPKAGVYELVLSGTPKSGDSFKPFEIKYDVTVTPGKKTATVPSPDTEPQFNQQSESLSEFFEDATASEPQLLQWWLPVGIFALVILGIGSVLLWKNATGKR
ncbi:hypothetical protein [Moorena bouillonii]|uniref:Uncharacterized protein n=1 Tax=Moorena bouillonii PNG TaxID=568701 RepID=A0A1U7N1Q1_9CYAN|nr:hypothetical protein [Moorena bouillonii]OLT59856.1 hypothetical protein BJP37_13320 [Moorena bouillonii PNG]